MAIKAIILAAGRGSRLNPYTESLPKPMTELGGITLLERQIKTLLDCGISDIILVTGYLNKHLNFSKTRQIYNSDWQTTNMVESLFCAEKEFGNDIIISYGDIVYERKVLKSLINAQNEISVAVNTDWHALWEARFEEPLSDAETLKFVCAHMCMNILMCVCMFIHICA